MGEHISALDIYCEPCVKVAPIFKESWAMDGSFLYISNAKQADETGDVPDSGLLAPYAEKICAHLEKIVPAQTVNRHVRFLATA